MKKNEINPWRWQEPYGFVHANQLVGAPRLLLCSGQSSLDDDGNPIHLGDMAGQINFA